MTLRVASGVAVPSGKSVVYFVVCAGFVKIGTTVALAHRMSALATGSPLDMVLLGWLEGGKDLEERLHLQVDAHAETGEWFRLSPGVRDLLREVRIETLARNEAGERKREFGLQRLREPTRPMAMRVPGRLLARVDAYAEARGLTRSGAILELATTGMAGYDLEVADAR